MLRFLKVLPAAFVAASLAVPQSAFAVNFVLDKAIVANAGQKPQETTLGPVDKMTCFLSTLTGDFNGLAPHFSEPNNENLAQVMIIQKSGSWVLHAQPGTGTGVKGVATCIDVTAGQQAIAQTDNLTPGSAPTMGTDPEIHCFLSGVTASTGFGPGMRLVIVTDGGKSGFTGSHVNNIAGDFDFGGATGECIHYKAQDFRSFDETGPVSPVGLGVKTVSLKDLDGSPIPVGAKRCFLFGIAGNWANSPDPLGLTDGATLEGDGDKPTQHWVMRITNDRTAFAKCFD